MLCKRPAVRATAPGKMSAEGDRRKPAWTLSIVRRRMAHLKQAHAVVCQQQGPGHVRARDDRGAAVIMRPFGRPEVPALVCSCPGACLAVKALQPGPSHGSPLSMHPGWMRFSESGSGSGHCWQEKSHIAQPSRSPRAVSQQWNLFAASDRTQRDEGQRTGGYSARCLRHSELRAV